VEKGKSDIVKNNFMVKVYKEEFLSGHGQVKMIKEIPLLL
jgi:hypothetical protein